MNMIMTRFSTGQIYIRRIFASVVSKQNTQHNRINKKSTETSALNYLSYSVRASNMKPVTAILALTLLGLASAAPAPSSSSRSSTPSSSQVRTGIQPGANPPVNPETPGNPDRRGGGPSAPPPAGNRVPPPPPSLTSGPTGSSSDRSHSSYSGPAPSIQEITGPRTESSQSGPSRNPSVDSRTPPPQTPPGQGQSFLNSPSPPGGGTFLGDKTPSPPPGQPGPSGQQGPGTPPNNPPNGGTYLDSPSPPQTFLNSPGSSQGSGSGRR